jgi:hypothetical protein
MACDGEKTGSRNKRVSGYRFHGGSPDLAVNHRR